MMDKKVKQGISWGIPLILIGGICLFRYLPPGAEWYARTGYPFFSSFLSVFSSWLPFSVGDCFIVGSCLWLAVYPFYAWWKRRKKWAALGKMVRFVLWVYIWFYFAWGMNYFRFSFYERTQIERAEYSVEEFQLFLKDYINGLNSSYDSVNCMVERGWYIRPVADIRDTLVASEINAGYREIAGPFGLVSPGQDLYPKPMLWSGGMSGVGVSGYMGPFFAEFNLNKGVLNAEYPFTYAHELAHRLGIASEAEANLYATLVTTRSLLPEIRFSGYFSILGYVLNNAYRLLPEEEYKEVLAQIAPDIIEIYRDHLKYWRDKYSRPAGKVQSKVYNAYLKGNQINNGTKNYSEVVGLLMSVHRDHRYGSW